MKKVEIKALNTKKTNTAVFELLNQFDGIYVEYKLANILHDRGISQRQLAELTGLRQATLSHIASGNTQLINKEVLFALMIALRVTSISDIIDIKLPPQVEAQFKKESKQWIKDKTPPTSTLF